MSRDDLVSPLQASLGARHPANRHSLIPLYHSDLAGSLIGDPPTLLEFLWTQIIPQLTHKLQEAFERRSGHHFRSQKLEVIPSEGSHLRAQLITTSYELNRSYGEFGSLGFKFADIRNEDRDGPLQDIEGRVSPAAGSKRSGQEIR